MNDNIQRSPVTYRPTEKTRQLIVELIDRTKPKYNNRNHFIDTAVLDLINKEVAGLTRKEVYQHDRTKRNRENNLEQNKKSNGDYGGQEKPTGSI